MNKNLDKFTAKDIMTGDVFLAYEGWSIKKLSDFFITRGISGAPVIASDHSLVGVVTATDIIDFDSKSTEEINTMVESIYTEYVGYNYQQDDIKKIAEHADENCTVHQIMTKSVIQVDQSVVIDDIAEIMLKQGVRRLFVTNKGIMVGVITTTNILQAIVHSGKLPHSNAA